MYGPHLGLKMCLISPSTSTSALRVPPIDGSKRLDLYDEAHVLRCRDDVLRFASQVLLHLVPTHVVPGLSSLDAMVQKWELDSLEGLVLEKWECEEDSDEASIKVCVSQCCSLEGDLRPDMESVVDWIDCLLEGHARPMDLDLTMFSPFKGFVELVKDHEDGYDSDSSFMPVNKHLLNPKESEAVPRRFASVENISSLGITVTPPPAPMTPPPSGAKKKKNAMSRFITDEGKCVVVIQED